MMATTSKPLRDALLLPCAVALAGALAGNAAAGPSGTESDTLVFANNDVLHGTFLGCDKDGIRWHSPASKAPFLFQRASVSEAKLDIRKPPGSAPVPTHYVLLTNGDEIPGAVVSLDDNTLVLNTRYAGRIAIPRGMISRFTKWSGGNDVLYRGPSGITEWVVQKDDSDAPKNSWIFKDGALVAAAPGGIRRDMKLPDRASIQFDLDLPAGDGAVSVNIYCANDWDAGNGYTFDIENGCITLQRLVHGNSTPVGDQVKVTSPMLRRENARLDIRVDKEAKRIVLIVNGKLAGQWTDEAGFAGTGSSLMFGNQNEGDDPDVKISNITVSAWDGRLDAPRTADARPSKQDSIEMENDDQVSGRLKGITDGMAHLASAYADVAIPLARIERIRLSGAGESHSRKGANDVRAWFVEGGSVTMDIETWDAKQITANSPNFGRAVFSSRAFQRVEFHPSNQSAPESDAVVESAGNGDD